MLDKMKELLLLALLVAVIGGIMSLLLGSVLGMVYAAIGWQTVLGGLIALGLLIYIATKTDLDKMSFVDIVVLFVAIGLVGTIITTLLPIAAPYILTVENWGNLTGIAWSLVYVGLALVVKDKVM